jgi:hypothetical protein
MTATGSCPLDVKPEPGYPVQCRRNLVMKIFRLLGVAALCPVGATSSAHPGRRLEHNDPICHLDRIVDAVSDEQAGLADSADQLAESRRSLCEVMWSS